MDYHHFQPRFGNLYAESKLRYEDIDQLAKEANATRDTVLTMMRGQTMHRETAQNILDAFNRMTHKKISLDRLDIKFLPEEPLAREEECQAE